MSPPFKKQQQQPKGPPPVHQPPLDAERAVLGSMMVEQEAVERATALLQPSDFFSPKHRYVFEAAVALKARRCAVDIITLADELRKAGKWEEFGDNGFETLSGFVHATSTAMHVGYYAGIVRRAGAERELDRAMLTLSHERTPEAARAVLEATERAEGVIGGLPLDMRDQPAMEAVIDRIMSKHKTSVSTGFADLDDITMGLEPGDVVTVGGRAGVGKTAFMVSMCVPVAESGVECLYFTTEMPQDQILTRILPSASGVPAWKFRKRAFHDDDKIRIGDAYRQRIVKIPIRIIDRPRPSVAEIAAAVSEYKPRVVFVDYLQRLKPGQGDLMSYQVADNMANLKTMARERGVTVIIGCQLDRKLDKTGMVPSMSDLKDSGAIEAESDQIILLWKPGNGDHEAGPPAPEGYMAVEALVVKNRHGMTGQRAHLMLDRNLVNIVERRAQDVSAAQPRLGDF